MMFQPVTVPPALSYCKYEQFAPPERLVDEWIPLTPIEEMASRHYDVLIVGSGAGGSAALWRLCQHYANTGKKVGIVERGRLLLSGHAANIPTVGSARIDSLYMNPRITDFIGDRLPEYPGAKLVYALGGRTLFWGAVSPRVPDYELVAWPIPIGEMYYYYGIAEQMMNVTHHYAAESSFTQILLERLRASGFPESGILPIAANLAPTQYGRINSNVYSSAINFFAFALNTHPFDLAVNARAVQVLLEGGRAAGIRVVTPDKGTFDLHAKTVVLSASALETPRILLYSGINGPAIGHYLTNHSIVTTNGLASSEGFPEILGTINILVPQAPYRPFQLQLQGSYFSYQFETKPRKQLWSMGFFGSIGQVESRYENCLGLNPADPDEYGIPKIQVRFNYSARDWEVIEASRAAMARVSEIIGLRPAEGAALDYCLYEPGGDAHEYGTCRMGYDPRTSATDPFGQIHGVPGLFVADNSVIPGLGASNPVLTTAALAIRTADYIAKS